MNHPSHRSRLRGLCAAAAAALLQSAGAQPVAEPGFAITPAYTHTTGDALISYDWASATGLYYMTSAGFPDTQVWKTTGGAPQNIYSNPNTFAGNNVVAIGDYVYFNDSALSGTQSIYRYGPVSGAAATTLTSTAINFGLYGQAGQLFITAYGSAPNIYLSSLAADGHLLNDPPLSLGDPASGLGGTAFSGPLVFDLAGNLYYAPGSGDPSIYKFAASEVANAIAQTGQPLKVSGHRWLSYAAAYPMKGASSLLIEPDGDLLITLTSFSESSVLVEYGVAQDGSYDNTATEILTDPQRLGELRSHDGKTYVSSGNSIYEVVPEPGTIGLFAIGLGALAGRRRRTSPRTLALAGTFAMAASAMAGPYSTALENQTAHAPDAGIPGFTGPAGAGVVATVDNGNVINKIFVGWATTVVAYAPAPGVSTIFANASLALGPLTGDNTSIVSLGDVPAGTTRPNPGTLTLGVAQAIINGPGADFATFENGFISEGEAGVEGQIFGELGYVEVSTDGVQFARFPSVSLTPEAVGPLGTVDASNVYNLVGKHVNARGDSWGTPFDLSSLANEPSVIAGLVDLNKILYIRIVDIPGDGTWLDSAGHAIFDAWLTNSSGGVDFEALGVIHQIPEPRETGWLMLGLGSLLAARPRVA